MKEIRKVPHEMRTIDGLKTIIRRPDEYVVVGAKVEA
jgi:hypothetical protein